MQIYFHSRLCSYLSRVPILVEGTVDIFYNIYIIQILGDWGGRSRTCFWSGSWGSWSLWSNSSHAMVTAAGATRLLYRHQKSMHCINTQILWLFNALYRLRDCQRLLLRDCHWSRPLRECKQRRCFQPIKILQFCWCYFVIGRGILQPLLELLNTEPASDCF